MASLEKRTRGRDFGNVANPRRFVAGPPNEFCKSSRVSSRGHGSNTAGTRIQLKTIPDFRSVFYPWQMNPVNYQLQEFWLYSGFQFYSPINNPIKE
jgi:hypothetical protein